MAACHDSAGFKLFTELYRKKRAKDGRRELPKKEFEAKTSAHWNALPTEKHKRYNDEAIRRLTRTPMKRRYICSTRCTSRKGNHTPRHSRKDYRSRSPLSYRTDRSRSWSDSTARTEYLGDTTYYSDSSYTDTANTCYDEDDCSDATSCSSIASSYDDLTDPTLREPRPATLAKSSKPVRKVGKGKMASTSKASRAKVTANKKSAQKASRQRVSKRKAETKKAAETPIAPNKGRKRGKPAKKRAKVNRVHKPRPVATKKVVPLRRTRASRNVNVTDKREKATPPRQLEKEELKTPVVEVNTPDREQQVNE